MDKFDMNPPNGLIAGDTGIATRKNLPRVDPAQTGSQNCSDCPELGVPIVEHSAPVTVKARRPKGGVIAASVDELLMQGSTETRTVPLKRRARSLNPPYHHLIADTVTRYLEAGGGDDLNLNPASGGARSATENGKQHPGSAQ